MNKTEKIWVVLLVAALIGYTAFTWNTGSETPPPAPAAQPAQTAAAPAETPAAPQAPAAEATPAPAAEVKPAEPALPPEDLTILNNDKVMLVFSSHGLRLTSAELKEYRAGVEEDSGNKVMPLGDLLALSVGGRPLAYTLDRQDDRTLVATAALPSGVTLTRTLRLDDAYTLTVEDRFVSATAQTLPAYTFNAGAFTITQEELKQGDYLGVDLLTAGQSEAEHWEKADLGEFLGAGSAFLGCGTSTNLSGLPEMKQETFNDRSWVALKNRFFVALAQAGAPTPITLTVRRTQGAEPFLNQVSAALNYPALALQPGQAQTVTTRLYVGPKELSSLTDFGDNAKDVMNFGAFGWFRWLCGMLLHLLNWLHALIPNYGVAIILLTILVRLVFWPLTHKSTVAMRRMTAIQPLMKELQAKYKDNPQKMQQETFKLYREHKVNPLSSCLPMLVQIPIFIALYYMLQSAVELRFQSFLWISDLTQPERLFADFFPFGGLNILPILTAVTMGLQTHLSPSSGDPAQKRMMVWMMPIMMLWIFYAMPSALCLYWTVSQLLSILQMWYIQRTTKTEPAK